ncbi:hypothetical protein EK904_014043 [Melospiza melodia maxima]|nr:hypothetical protein EK904_014043 [Melospiza melodia maxima]
MMRMEFKSLGDCHLIHYLRLSHHLIVLNYLICTFDKLKSVSSEDVKITDAVFDGVEVRVFEPPAKGDESLKRSVVYIHGGGWALASARTSLYNNLCRIMAESLNAVVVSVEYRLVPEVCFPEQYHDALRATKHFLQPDVLAEYSVDPSRIAISGDSAGGNLAAAVCQQLSKDEDLPVRPKLQALIYPVLQAFDFNTPSYQQNMNMPVLPRYVMINYWIDYINGNYDLAHELLVNNHTALNNDVLRDDGAMYAARLERAGVPVTLDHFHDCFHGCMIFTVWPTDFSAGVKTRNSYIKWLDENL